MRKIFINEIFRLEDFKESIPFTALGARTCYSSGDLDYLLNDPRVISKEDRAKFLSKLGNYKHFSVFAHSFAYKDLVELDEELIDKYLEKEFLNLSKNEKAKILALKISATHFKSEYNPEYPTVIGVSLRHYLEDLLQYDEKEYFNAFKEMVKYDIPVEPLGSLENTTLIGLLKDYDGYAVFYIDKISRVCTHQLVRHTSLNFSQRSQRYVKEDENQFIIPPSIKNSSCKLEEEEILKKSLENVFNNFYKELEKVEYSKAETKEKILKSLDKKIKELNKKDLSLEDLFKIFDSLSEVLYDYSIYKCKIKREDGRFILPHGRRTTIVVSGTLKWIKDFILKRTDEHAQWEIRNIANQMKTLLEKEGIKF